MKLTTLEVLLKNIEVKKQQLDALRPLPPELIAHLHEWYKVELTYTSNALEGNTLTRTETALVVEKGITIGGKPLRDHLEAINHAHALDFVLQLAHKMRMAITLHDILDIHRIVLKGIDDKNAGRLRTIAVGIAGSEITFPTPVKLPELMTDFIAWMHAASGNNIIISADAHFKLVAIHPFVDGNGRTARLLMNLLLIQAGYPPAVILPTIRKQYIEAIQKAEIEHDSTDFYIIIAQAVEKSIDHYLKYAQETI